MSKPHTVPLTAHNDVNTTTPPEGPGFKELEFQEDTYLAFGAEGPFGVSYRVWKSSLDSLWRWRWQLRGAESAAATAPTYSAAVQAANEHCHKELGRWVR